MFIYNLKRVLMRFRILIIVLLSILFLGGSYYIYLKYTPKEEIVIESEEKKETLEVIKEEVVEAVKKYKVDVKGQVKKPGVYEIEENSRVIDVINKAGGLTTKADTRVTNLSKVIFDEMVIVVYSQQEVKDFVTTKEKENTSVEECKKVIPNDSCVCPDKEVININNKVSLNTGTKEELLTIPGIGEAKAISIIQYRDINKFKTIEELMNVSGIGEKLFEQIKEYITI